MCTIRLKLHLVDSLSTYYTNNFATNTVTNWTNGAWALVYRIIGVYHRRCEQQRCTIDGIVDLNGVPWQVHRCTCKNWVTWAQSCDLLSLGWDCLHSTCVPYSKSLGSSTTKIRNAMQNAETGVVWGHPRSSLTSLFNRAHTISYPNLIQTMHLPHTVLELQRVICRKWPILTNPTCTLQVWPH